MLICKEKNKQRVLVTDASLRKVKNVPQFHPLLWALKPIIYEYIQNLRKSQGVKEEKPPNRRHFWRGLIPHNIRPAKGCNVKYCSDFGKSQG